MTAIITRLNTEQKLDLLSSDAQYDLSCACSTKDPAEHRKRGTDGRWIYPVTLPNGGSSVIFKTLISNACTNDCKYCPLRIDRDTRRFSLNVNETVDVFLDYLNRKKVFGLFLTSGLCGNADRTMERLTGVAETLRKRHKFRGYIHLKIIPGASRSAIEKAVSLASAVSLNIETPGEKNLKKLTSNKDYLRDIIEPIKYISSLTSKGMKYSRVKQTTQFIVGAAGESDSEIVRYMDRIYDRLNMQRIYFSAYQKGLGHGSLPGENDFQSSREDIFMREHRLYQADFLLRRYGFSGSDLSFSSEGRLSLGRDPKEVWAMNHPEQFPVNINTATKYQLLRVPGLGPLTVKKILEYRRRHRIWSIGNLGKAGKLLARADRYLCY